MSVPEIGYMSSQWIHWQAWFPVRCDTLSMYFIRLDFMVHKPSSMFHFTSHHNTHSPYMLWWVIVWPRCNGAFNTANHWVIYHSTLWTALIHGCAWTKAKHGHITMLWHATAFCPCVCKTELWNGWIHAFLILCEIKKVCMMLQWRVTCSVFIIVAFHQIF